MENVILESTLINKLHNSAKLIGVEYAEKQKELIITCQGKAVSLFTLADGDPRYLKDWSISSGIQTCPAVIDQEGQYHVAYPKELRTWSKGTMVLDKAKKTKIPKTVVKVTCFGDSVILLYTDGSYAWKDSPTHVHSEHSQEKLIDCHANQLQNNKLVITCCFVQESKYTIECHKFIKDQKKANTLTTKLELPTDEAVISSATLSTKFNLTVYVLTNKCRLYAVNMDNSSNKVIFDFGDKLNKQAHITTVRDSYIAISGIKQNTSEEGFGIWDTKYKVLKLWKPYADKVTKPQKIAIFSGYMFVPCDCGLYLHQFSLKPSTLGSVLGSLATAAPLGHNSELDEQIQVLSDPKKSGTHKEFKQAFNKFITTISSQKNVHLGPVLHRCLHEKNFWPQKELQKILELKIVPHNLVGDVVKGLANHGDIGLLRLSMDIFNDIPEASLIACLHCFLGSSDETCKKISDEELKLPEDLPKEPQCPFSACKVMLINKVLTKIYNDVFLLDALHALPFSEALDLLRYLHFLMCVTTASLDSSVIPGAPNLLQITDWVCLVLDSHFTQIVLSTDARDILVHLHTIVESQCQFYEELVSLEGILSTLKEKCTPPVSLSVGIYCIETLHVH